jgi:hypothetical protein
VTFGSGGSGFEIDYVEDGGRGADFIGDVAQGNAADAEPSSVIHDCRRWPAGAIGSVGADVAQRGEVM